VDQCVDEIVQEFIDKEHLTTARVKEALRCAISGASKRYEVVIKTQAWQTYLDHHGLEEPSPGKKTKSGRKEKAGWRALCVIIGAYVLAHRKETNEEIKSEAASKAIHKIAKAKNIGDLPAAGTIKDVISELNSVAATISMK
jgi:hypothetical protein